MFSKFLVMTLLCMLEKNRMLKKSMLIQIFYALGLYIFVQHFLINGLKKRMEKFILRKPNISPYLFNTIIRFIYCGNIELKNLQGSDVLKLLIAVDELNIQQLIYGIFLEKIYDLNMNEIEVWESLLTWCLCQQNMESDQTKWNFFYKFTDGKNISTAKLGYVKKPNYAIYCDNSQGPHMGIPTSNFSVDYYEVFQVIIK
ncbi:BTB/POZ protein [Rhizophagus irregularis DAOM 181602=DAOM 197198]|nr:BTB/POZ protein [Rhizophagus irregularis DAOM 181602=DAOM 197198]